MWMRTDIIIWIEEASATSSVRVVRAGSQNMGYTPRCRFPVTDVLHGGDSGRY